MAFVFARLKKNLKFFWQYVNKYSSNIYVFFCGKCEITAHNEHFYRSMTYKVEEFDNKRVVHLIGEIDMEVSDKARNTILPLIEAGHDVHLNLSKVEYMDSSGISVLIESKKLSEQKNTKFELVEVSKPVEKVLAMARKFL